MSKLQSNDFLNISCIVEDSKFSNLKQKIKNKIGKLENHITTHPSVYKRGFNALNWGSGAYFLYDMLHNSNDETGEDKLANNDH
jgi:CRISPR/Cas system CSM-associated protein Csm4 (group 5 of RAMP superfamily)